MGELFSRKLFLTRLAEDNHENALLLEEWGISTLSTPLSTVSLKGARGALDFPSIFVVTSRHGVAWMAQEKFPHDISLFLVGEKTYQAARTHGFSNIQGVDQEHKGLIKRIKSAVRPGEKLCYLRGDAVRAPLAKNFTKYLWTEKIVYDVHCQEFPPNLERHLQERKLWGGVFLSQRISHFFCKEIFERKHLEFLNGLFFFCISHDVADCFNKLGLRIEVPSQPTWGHLSSHIRQRWEETIAQKKKKDLNAE